MEITLTLLANAFGLSLAFNVFQFRKFRKLKKAGPSSYEVRDLLRDLSAGEALVAIRRIDPSSVMLHSPRDLA